MSTTAFQPSSPSTHAAWRLPGATLLWTAVSLGLWALGPSALGALEYDRIAIQSGAFFRLLTGHLTHSSSSHLFWDALMFLTLGAWVELDDRRAWPAVVLLSAILIPLGLFVADPSLHSYRGLSGIDSALFAFIATRWLARPGALRWLGGAALVAFVTKAAFEWTSGTTLFADLEAGGATVVPLAHLLGAVGGAAVAVAFTSRASVVAPRHNGSTHRRDEGRAA